MHAFRRTTVMGAILAGCLLVPTTAFASAPAANSASQASTASPTAHPADAIVMLKAGKVPFSGTGCTHNIFGTELVCIYVNGTGLVVNYATVTNEHAPTGRAYISDTYDGATYAGPQNFGPGQAWRKNFYLHMNNGDKVCGSVSGLNVACITIHT
jgi:hypothetical protein